MIFDTHAHYDDRAFDDDRDELLRSMPEKGIGRIVNVASTYESNAVSLALSEKYEDVYTSVGLHPTEIYDIPGTDSLAVNTEILDEISEMCSRPKVVAIGEIGLDYHYDDTDKPMQMAYFDAQLEIALKKDLPVIIHSRDAAADTMEQMRTFAKKGGRGVIHCFSYSYEMAAEYVKMGYFIGIGGVVTFKNARKLKECAKRSLLRVLSLKQTARTLHRFLTEGRETTPHILNRWQRRSRLFEGSRPKKSGTQPGKMRSDCMGWRRERPPVAFGKRKK